MGMIRRAKFLFSFDTSNPPLFLVHLSHNLWLQMPCGRRLCCSVRRKMVRLMGGGTGHRTAEMKSWALKVWANPLLSLTSTLDGSLTCKCPLF